LSSLWSDFTSACWSKQVICTRTHDVSNHSNHFEHISTRSCLHHTCNMRPQYDCILTNINDITKYKTPIYIIPLGGLHVFPWWWKIHQNKRKIQYFLLTNTSPLLSKNSCIVSIFSCSRACSLSENTRICGVPVWLVPGLTATQAAEKPWERGWFKSQWEFLNVTRTQSSCEKSKKVNALPKVVGFLLVLRFSPTGKVDRVG
jgi:hypothetical protein